MTRDLLRWNNTTPRLYVRANPLMPMKNIPASLAPLDRAPGWFSVEGLLPLEEIKTGSLYVADPSTRYSIDLLAPQPGEEILDACAAPGGKSAAIIAATGGKAHLTATDLHEHRLPTLKETWTGRVLPSSGRHRRTGPFPAARNGRAALTPCFWTFPVPTPESSNAAWTCAGA